MAFEENSRFKLQDKETPIWRYMDFESFVWTLQEEKIHFHQAADFDDPFEGAIPNYISEKYDSESIDRQLRWSEYSREFTFLSCWHQNSSQSAAMWDLYGNGNRSIAIKSSISDIEESLSESNLPFGVGPVFYVDFESGPDEIDKKSKELIKDVLSDSANLKDTFHLKRESFEHEEEIRIFSIFTEVLAGNDEFISELKDYELPFDLVEFERFDDFSGLVPKQNGFNVEVDLDKMINEVWIGPDAPRRIKNALGKTVDQAPHVDLSSSDIYRSKMYESPWD
jgi:hypothetical protein